MSDAKVPALAGLLRQAGLSWSQADEVTAAVDRLHVFDDGSDCLAGCLFDWRRKFARQQLAGSRERCRKIASGPGVLDAIEQHVTEAIGDLEGEDQFQLFDTVDEVARAQNALIHRGGV